MGRLGGGGRFGGGSIGHGFQPEYESTSIIMSTEVRGEGRGRRKSVGGEGYPHRDMPMEIA